MNPIRTYDAQYMCVPSNPIKTVATRLHRITGREDLPFVAVCGSTQMLVTSFPPSAPGSPVVIRGIVICGSGEGLTPGTEVGIGPISREWRWVEVLHSRVFSEDVEKYHADANTKTTASLLSGIPEAGVHLTRRALAVLTRDAFNCGVIAEFQSPSPGR